MGYMRHSISAVLAVMLIAGPRPAAFAQSGWPGRDGDIQVEPMPEGPPSDYRGGPEPDYRGEPDGQGAPEAGAPAGDADLGEFYEQLQPHGEWIDHPEHGSVWSPYAQEQEAEWRPYTRGQWIMTEEHGWYWESEEPFGWATYHYGRWFFDPGHGWLWVPGTVWGPAWVAWRESEDAIGWVPLPPEAEWYPDRGIVYRSGYSIDSPRYAALWVFVGASLLLAPRVYRHFYPPTRTTWYFGRTRTATFYRYDNRRIFNRGINPGIVARRIGRPVPIMPVRPVPNFRDSRFSGPGRTFVGVYRPQFRPRGDGRPSAPPFVDRTRTPPPSSDLRRFDPNRRFDPQRPADRDRGLPRPDGNRPPWQERARTPLPGDRPTVPPQRPDLNRPQERPPERARLPDARPTIPPQRPDLRPRDPQPRPPEVRRELPPQRPEGVGRPNAPFEPRFGRSPADGGPRPQPRDVQRPAERPRDVVPPRGAERPPGAQQAPRNNPAPEARRAPGPDPRAGAPPARGEPPRDKKEPPRRPQDVQGRGPGG